MSAVTRPRGPLPARVYWVRRLLVLVVVALLVVAITQLVGGGDSGSTGSDDAVASPAAAEQRDRDAGPGAVTPGAADSTGSPAADADQRDAHEQEQQKQGKKKAKKKQPLPPATGPCEPSDIVVTPVVEQSEAGSPVPITLELTSTEAIACSWTASRDTLVVTITSGEDDIWTSRQCPGQLGRSDVVVRRETPARVTMQWSARRSDEGCTYLREWALPGWYHATAAAYGGEPTDVQFELTKPERPVVERTVAPKPKPDKKQQQKQQPTKKKQQQH